MMKTNTKQQDMHVVSVQWFPSEKVLFKPKEKISTADHAEAGRVVIKSAKAGNWHNYNNPPLVGIMNVTDREGNFINVRTVACKKCVQGGVSEAAYNVVFKKMDGSGQNATVVMENERKTGRVSKQRIIPALRAHKILNKQLSTNPDDTSQYSITTKSGFSLNIGWSGSAASVSSDPVETMIIDEVDKYKSILNLEEAKDRTTTFRRTGITLIFSTPGLVGGPIDIEYNNCDAHMDYYVQCPDCDTLQIMEFQYFDWPRKDESLNDDKERIKLANIISRESSARYTCPHCGSFWDDYKRDKAVRLGSEHNYHGWKMREEIQFPISVGFHFPSWISPFKSLSDIVSRWLKANIKTVHSIDLIQKWHNNEAAEAFEPSMIGEGLSPEILYEQCQDYFPDIKKDKNVPKLPMEGLVLTCAVDVQDNRLEADVKLWGPGFEPWGVEHRIFPGKTKLEFGMPGSPYNDLENFLVNSRWLHESGVKLGLSSTFIDSSGLTRPVYRFVSKSRALRLHAIKGSSIRGKPLLNLPSDQRKRSKGKTVSDAYNVPVIIIGTEIGKDMVFSWFSDPDPKNFIAHWHKGYSLNYFKQLTAEHRVTTIIKGRPVVIWQPKKRGTPNEALDLNVYNYACIELLNPDFEGLLKDLRHQVDGTPTNKKSGNRKISKGIDKEKL